MKTFTTEEIAQDIFDFEKIKIQFKMDESNSYFISKYSDWKKKCTSDEKTVDDLMASINEFILKFATPPLEIPIPDECDFAIYAGHKGIPLKFIISTNSEDEVKEKFSQLMKGGDSYTAVCVVERTEVLLFYKQLDS